MSYLGQAALKNSELKRFAVTSSTSATHTLSWTAPNEQSLFITINGVKQQDGAYTIAGSPTVITLSSALVATDEMEVIGVLDIGTITTVGDDAISTAKIGDNAITFAKIADQTQGDVLVYGASGAPGRLAIGTAGQALVVNTGATAVEWGDGGGATGGGTDKIFYNNGQTVTTAYTVPSGENAMSAGPVSVNSGINVTLTGTSEWVIV